MPRWDSSCLIGRRVSSVAGIDYHPQSSVAVVAYKERSQRTTETSIQRRSEDSAPGTLWGQMLPCIHTIRAPGIALLYWITDLSIVSGHLFVSFNSFTPSKLRSNYYVCYGILETAMYYNPRFVLI